MNKARKGAEAGEHKGELHLFGLTKLSDAAAESLSKVKGEICVNETLDAQISSYLSINAPD